MQSNQRARLVLGPTVLVLVLLSAGLIAGIGFSRYRNHDSSSAGKAGASELAANGIVLSSERLDFGVVGLDRSVVRQLLLRTTGASAVRIRIEGSDSFVVDPSTLTVEPGKVSRVTVTASPKQSGSFRDQLRIFADGGSKTPMVVVLEGRARAGNEGVAEGEGGPEGEDGTALGSLRVIPGDEASGANGLTSGEVTGGAVLADGTTPGSVQITRSSAEDEGGLAGGVDVAGATGARGSNPGMVVVPVDPSRSNRSISDRSNVPSADTPPQEGEEPSEVSNSKKPTDLDKKKKDTDDPQQTIPILTISPSSTLSALGSKNQFYPQRVPIVGSIRGGSFSLAAALQLPSIPIAFGQTMSFTQTGAVTGGTYNASSGDVEFMLPMEAVDPNGNGAPFKIRMSTGSAVTRNNNGVVISLVGQRRAPDSGVLRLVGIGQVPTGFRNAAEEQFVLVEIWASLTFPSSTAGGSSSEDSSSGGTN